MSGGPAASPAASPAGPGDAGPAAVPILMYHQIAAGQRSRLAVTPAAFAAQLADLDAGGFTPVSAAALAAALAGGGPPLPARPVVLTFDDGYADFHAAALPLLASYGFTATLFVTTGWLRPAAGRAVSQPCPAPALSWSQLAEAAAAGLEIAGHSHSHPQLDRVPAGRLRDELAGCKELLEARLGQPVSGLAFPYGYSSQRVRRAAADCGHRYACAVRNELSRPDSDPFALPRLTVRRSTSLSSFGQVVRGRRVPLIYLPDRSLTRGWSVIRRGRALADRMTSGA
ncbi:MAG: polysaccharide deacetylase family protein [Streptosporangiaceae bacterium]|jgi:peptidoglycan/xylan/chitin deacetylase (PgdA/CDA1 family)|nr:polysaccharide deacetylase [Actinomycetota bacterium]